MKMNQESRNSSGFTLVELVVAMSVFVVAITFASGIFIQGIQSQRNVTKLIVVNNEMSVALERIAREVRVGYMFNAPSLNELTFRIQGEDGEDEKHVTYSLVDGVVSRDDGVSRDLTGRNVEVTDLKFSIARGDDTLCSPWRITVSLQVKPSGSDATPIAIQTTVSSRVLPLDLEIDERPPMDLNDFEDCRRWLVRT